MELSVGKIAAGVFIGNALFAIVAWLIASIALGNARFDRLAAGAPAAEAEAKARLAETCASYKASVSDKDRDPTVSTLCPD